MGTAEAGGRGGFRRRAEAQVCGGCEVIFGQADSWARFQKAAGVSPGGSGSPDGGGENRGNWKEGRI